MATVKSSAENLTLNADGANNDIIFQSNGSNVATLDQAGTLTATTFTGAATDATKLPLAGGTMTGVINAADGTEANPMYRFASAASGMYMSGSDNIGFSQGGNRIMGVTTAGLCFGSDTAAANALDDYEEGTFTASITDGTNTATGTSTLTYTKIGNRVIISGGNLQTSNLNGVSGNTKVAGLPFTAAGHAAISVGNAEGLNITAGQTITGYVGAGTTTITLMLNDSAAGTTALQGSEWSDNGGAQFAASYHTSA